MSSNATRKHTGGTRSRGLGGGSLTSRNLESVRLRQAEHALGDVAEDELAAHRRDAADEGLAQIALDVVLARVAEAAMGHHRLLTSVEARFAGEVLGRVRLGAAGLAAVVEPGGLERHQVRRLERHPVRRERMLDRLVLADRAVEHDALLCVRGSAGHREAAEADELGGDEDALRVHAVQDALEALALLADAVLLG